MLKKIVLLALAGCAGVVMAAPDPAPAMPGQAAEAPQAQDAEAVEQVVLETEEGEQIIIRTRRDGTFTFTRGGVTLEGQAAVSALAALGASIQVSPTGAILGLDTRGSRVRVASAPAQGGASPAPAPAPMGAYTGGNTSPSHGVAAAAAFINSLNI